MTWEARFVENRDIFTVGINKLEGIVAAIAILIQGVGRYQQAIIRYVYAVWLTYLPSALP